jgi:drug/metabolite transporter (DMT)-like permease
MRHERGVAAFEGSGQGLAKAAMVVLWSSGYIVGALATRHMPALTATFWRFAAAAPLMALIAVATGASWPRLRDLGPVVAVGVLLQVVQFSGVYLSLEEGMPAGLVALLAGSSPLLVAVAGSLVLDERLDRRQWLGSAIGVAGVVLAVAEELHGPVTVAGFLLALLGLSGLVGGTLVQRRHGGAVDHRAANAIQLAVAAAVMVPVAGLAQGLAAPETAAAIGPLVWLVGGLSIGAVLLYFWLLRREKGGEATSFLYLVPSVTAIAAVPVLGQSLSAGAVAGLVLALAGVRMVSARPLRPARRAARILSRPAADPAG